LDQRVAAGIGNVFKSELLFLERVHPDTGVADLADETLLDLGRRARRLIPANVGERRSTTGERSRGRETWVYGREGKPCRRCGSPVEMGRRQERVTFWCPVCQPAPD
ncbi:MAG: DNA glycosylase, partial [Actinobacteria bacterium]|nr:DNA glycosylase [Actinomycetota bacterium]